MTTPNDYKINLRDFSGLRGLEFNDFFKVLKFKSVAEWQMTLHDDEDGKFFRFELVSNLSYGRDTIVETLVMWVGEDGTCTIELENDSMDYKVSADRTESLFKKLNINQD